MKDMLIFKHNFANTLMKKKKKVMKSTWSDDSTFDGSIDEGDHVGDLVGNLVSFKTK